MRLAQLPDAKVSTIEPRSSAGASSCDAIVPSRRGPGNDIILYGNASADARAAMRMIAADIASKAQIPVSATVLRWTDAGWVAE